jgi:hypothetical protein
MEKQWENSSSNNRSNNEDNEDRSFQSIGKESRGDQDDDLEDSDQDQDNRQSGMGSNGQNQSLSNMAYNWVSFVQHKAKAVKAYEQYISDAEAAGETECADLFRKACKADLEQLGQARNHLSAVLKETENAE